MSGESDVMVAYPPWKLEFLEKKRKKEAKIKEVPQWKRELLKRIQSKNQRMIEEQQHQQQADILEEHIPKVQDNIFLTHEKKPQRLPSAPPPLTIATETLPTSPGTITISVDNIVIIEKQDTTQPDEASPVSDPDSVKSEDTKEYPKAGIVHRLMGRFQSERAEAQAKKNTFYTPTYQRPKSSPETRTEQNRTVQPIQPVTPPPRLDNIRAEETPPPTVSSTVDSIENRPAVATANHINKTETNSEPLTMSSDMISPLLISSAKPFSRQNVSSNSEPGFHHVKVPIRKVSAPTSPKSATLSTKPDPTVVKTNDAIPCPSEFSDDLSSLHANKPESPILIKETLVIAPEKKQDAPAPTQVPKRVNLQNGETLHSSGYEALKKPEAPPPVAKPAIPPRRLEANSKLQDKSNFSSHKPIVKEEPKKFEGVSLKPIHDPSPQSTDATSLPDVVVKPSLVKSEAKYKPQPMKENRAYAVPPSKRKDKAENEYKKVVNESFDESTLKSPAAKAANRIMQNSKTFKITPSKQAQKNSSTSPSVPKPDPVVVSKPSPTFSDAQGILPNGTSHQSTKTPPIPLRKHETEKLKNDISQPSIHERPIPQSNSVKEPIQQPNKILTTSIDDILDSIDVKTSVTPAVHSAPVKKKKVQQNASKTVEKSQTTPQPAKQAPKTLNLPVNRTAPSTISVVPKTENSQKQSIFGPKITKSSSSSSRGKSFTIDPSKFKRSSAQPAAASAASGYPQDTGNTRVIVPGAKSTNTDAEFGGEQPKSGKRKLTVDQITVIGGYVTLEKSCLSKDTKRKKSVTISFPEKDLETTYTYESERSLLKEHQPTVEVKNANKSPGFAKDSPIGKYTPKYLLSMKDSEILDEDDDSSESKSATDNSHSGSSTPNDATPLAEDSAVAWSDTTSGSTDILF